MMSTQRGNIRNTKELKKYGRNLPIEDNLEYLGAILDTKLAFKFHVEIIIQKATRVLWARSMAVAKTWLLKPKITIL